MSSGVSCLCLTYGRPLLLEEAIESFLRQQWDGPKELVIVNDHPTQELVFNHSEVVVVNVNRRLRTLGEKRNLSVALAKYDYLLVWDDDDIHLPWRIEETMKELPEGHFFKCPQVWQTNRGVFDNHMWHGDFYYHCTAAYSRYIFEQIGGYSCMNGGEDLDFEERIRRGRNVSKYWGATHLPLERVYYIYRRGHGHYHASGILDLREIEPDVQEGKYQLEPKWHLDYCKEVSKVIELFR
jgi:glycosyltransferase involved in cell wall biosynthesis